MIQHDLGQEITKKNDQTTPILLKTIIFIPLVGCFTVYRLLYQSNFYQECIYDAAHQVTYNINRWMAHGSWLYALLAGQFIVDGWMTFITFFWMIKVSNCRLAGGLMLFFGIRTLYLNLDKFPFPKDIVWKSTGIPTLMQPYDMTRDFFYSGHSGGVFMCFLELFKMGYNKLALFCGLCSVYMMLLLVVSRIHYGIDVFSGILYSLFFYQFATLNVIYFDKIFNFPAQIVIFIFNKCKPAQQKNTSLIQDDIRQQNYK